MLFNFHAAELGVVLEVMPLPELATKEAKRGHTDLMQPMAVI